MFSASAYQQEAEVSIAQKPAHRRQALQAKFKGNHSKQAVAIETPLRDGHVKHYFIKSEQMGFNSLTAKSVLAGEKLVATYSIPT